MEENKKEPEKRFGEIRIMWSAFFLSSIFYIIIGHLAAGRMVPVTVHDIGLLKKFIYFLIAVTLAASCYFRKLMLNIRKKEFSQIKPAVRYRNAVSVSSLTANVTGMYGLGLFFHTGDFQILYTVVALSSVFIFFHRPKKHEFDRLTGPDSGSRI